MFPIRASGPGVVGHGGPGWHTLTMPREGHIATLRDLVGSMPLLLPSAAVFVHVEGRVVIGRHRDMDRWVVPGGALEPGELPADCAVREVWEETGLAVELVGIRGVFGGGPDHRIVYPNGDIVDYVVSVFDAVVVGGELAVSTHELDDLRLVDLDELRTLHIPPWLTSMLDHPGGWQPPDRKSVV